MGKYEAGLRIYMRWARKHRENAGSAREMPASIKSLRGEYPPPAGKCRQRNASPGATMAHLTDSAVKRLPPPPRGNQDHLRHRGQRFRLPRHRRRRSGFHPQLPDQRRSRAALHDRSIPRLVDHGGEERGGTPQARSPGQRGRSCRRPASGQGRAHRRRYGREVYRGAPAEEAASVAG